MDIQPISMRIPAPSIASGTPAQETTGPAPALDGFGGALKDALTDLSDAQNAADDKSVQLAAGEPIDLHEVMLSRETASLQFQLALQVRNKLVEAYQDVMRMQL